MVVVTCQKWLPTRPYQDINYRLQCCYSKINARMKFSGATSMYGLKKKHSKIKLETFDNIDIFECQLKLIQFINRIACINYGELDLRT